ncbi:hypothetical protein ACGG0V_004878 [Salmonella enterica]
MKIEISEKTKSLFNPFFELRLCGIEDSERHALLVKQCLDSFGKGKLSVNRPMADGFGILCFIFDTDLILFSEFCVAFGKRITEYRKETFAKKYLVFKNPKNEMESLKLMMGFEMLFNCDFYGCDYEEKVLSLMEKFNNEFGLVYEKNKHLVSMLNLNMERNFINNAVSSCEDSKKRKRL